MFARPRAGYHRATRLRRDVVFLTRTLALRTRSKKRERARPVYPAAFQLIQSKTPKTTTASAFLESQPQKAGHRLPPSFFSKVSNFSLTSRGCVPIVGGQ